MIRLKDNQNENLLDTLRISDRCVNQEKCSCKHLSEWSSLIAKKITPYMNGVFNIYTTLEHNNIGQSSIYAKEYLLETKLTMKKPPLMHENLKEVWKLIVRDAKPTLFSSLFKVPVSISKNQLSQDKYSFYRMHSKYSIINKMFTFIYLLLMMFNFLIALRRKVFLFSSFSKGRKIL